MTIHGVKTNDRVLTCISEQRVLLSIVAQAKENESQDNEEAS